MERAETRSGFRIACLSPLTVVIAIAFGYFASVNYPATITYIEVIEAQAGVTPSGFVAWFGSGTSIGLLWLFLVGVVAKDWCLATERARVWVNLLSLLLFAPYLEAARQRLAETSHAL